MTLLPVKLLACLADGLFPVGSNQATQNATEPVSNAPRGVWVSGRGGDATSCCAGGVFLGAHPKTISRAEASLGTRGAPWGKAVGTVKHRKEMLPASDPVNPSGDAVDTQCTEQNCGYLQLCVTALPFLRKWPISPHSSPPPNFIPRTKAQALGTAAGVCPVRGQGREDRNSTVHLNTASTRHFLPLLFPQIPQS